MPSKGSSGGGVTIQPYYDGRPLSGLQYVAGEGLSAISIKLSHNHCKFTADPHSRRPLVTCHQGINARNSFWNLHKPDLMKVKGLECSTSESVAQLFRAHNVENAGKPTYKRRMLRLLESLVVKKSKTSIKTAEELVPNRRLVAHQCVLAPLVHETEMKAPTVVSSHDFISQKGGGSDIYNEKLENTVTSVDTLFISKPQGANMLTNSSENTLIGIGFNKVMEPLNGDISPDLFTPLKETSGLDTARAQSISTVPSCLKLKNKQPLPHISTVGSTKSQYCEFDQGHIEHQDLSGNVEDEHNQVATKNYGRSGFEEIDKTTAVGIRDVINQGTSFFPASLSIPSPPVIQTIVDEILEEIMEIEDHISSYTSFLGVHEEELKSCEVVEHFFGEVRSTAKLKTENTESQSTNQSEVGRTTTCQTTDLLTNNEEENVLFAVEVSIGTHEPNLNEGNLDAILSHTCDSGIDLNMTEHDDSKKCAILNSSDTKSSVKLTNNNNSSINLIEFDEINIDKCEKTNCMTPMLDETAKITQEINDIFDIEFHTQSSPLQNYVIEDITVIESSSKEYKSESNNNTILETNILPDDTFGFNSAINGYCYWEESDVAINTGLSTEIPTNNSITHSTPENMFSHTGSALVSYTFMEDIWRQYFEVEDQDPFFMHVDGSGLFSNNGYRETLYDNDTYVQAEDVVNIDNFIVNGCAPSDPIESHYYNDSCTIVEIEDDFSQTEFLSEETFIARERSLIDSRYTDTINIKATRDNESKTDQNDEVFEVHNNKSRYSESNGRHLRSHNYLLDNSGDIDIENGERNATPNRVLTEKSRLFQVPRNTAKLDSQNPQMIFTSPNIQLNLTNPAANPNKK